MGTFYKGLRIDRVEVGHTAPGAGTSTDTLVYTIPATCLHAIVFVKYFGGNNADGGGGPTLAVKLRRLIGGSMGYTAAPLVDSITFSAVGAVNYHPMTNITSSLFQLGTSSVAIGGTNAYVQTAFPGDLIAYDKSGASGASDLVWFNAIAYLING